MSRLSTSPNAFVIYQLSLIEENNLAAIRDIVFKAKILGQRFAVTAKSGETPFGTQTVFPAGNVPVRFVSAASETALTASTLVKTSRWTFFIGNMTCRVSTSLAVHDCLTASEAMG